MKLRDFLISRYIPPLTVQQIEEITKEAEVIIRAEVKAEQELAAKKK